MAFFLTATAACGSGDRDEDQYVAECLVLACPTVSAGTLINNVWPASFDEISGMAVSSQNAPLLYAHNDEGDPQIYAVERNGTVRATISLVGQPLIDWEDMALGPGENGQPHIYVGDIGDNDLTRNEIRILRFPEPTIAGAASISIPMAAVDVFRLSYPGAVDDAESLAVDPRGPRIILATKSRDGVSKFYDYPMDATAARVGVLNLIAPVDLGTPSPGNGHATAADMKPDRSLFVVRDGQGALVWPLGDTCELADVLQRAPCVVPLLPQPQGEAIAFDGDGFLTMSEGINFPMHRYSVTP